MGRSLAPRSSSRADISRRPAGGCAVEELFSMLGRPHTLTILSLFQQQGDHPIRFRDLQARSGLSPRTLSDRLRRLVETGFLRRHAYRERPPRVEYEAMAKTLELGALFELLAGWAGRNSLEVTPTVSVVGKIALR